MAEISASWAVDASTYARGQLDVDGLTPDEIAERVDQLCQGASLCYQCAHVIEEPTVGELTAFYVDGREFTQGKDGHWRATDAADLAVVGAAASPVAEQPQDAQQLLVEARQRADSAHTEAMRAIGAAEMARRERDVARQELGALQQRVLAIAADLARRFPMPEGVPTLADTLRAAVGGGPCSEVPDA